ncbi:hypothetical protein F183_A06860 [Bryobacterales bacterium F-183]|nr:hypothetical protein F183_A06860 [Bryobacterales bacterium F-183]
MKKIAALFLAAAAIGIAQSKYEGPKPEKPDLPYLRHAAKLIPLETGQAKEETRKNEQWAAVAGASSPVRTPLAEPFFVMEMGRVDPKLFELYRVEPKNGQREVLISKKNKQGSKPLRIMVTPLGERLYRIDVNETLDNGEYCLSPSGSNNVFCFQVY